jgi:hypothetical protein
MMRAATKLVLIGAPPRSTSYSRYRHCSVAKAARAWTLDLFNAVRRPAFAGSMSGRQMWSWAR